MLWPLELPVKITFWLLIALVLLATLGSVRLNWAPRKTFVIASLMAFVGFVPSCSIVMKIVDARRFGIFNYASYDEVQDFRIERFLPPAARKITLEKTFIGHRAKYTIHESDLKSYVEGLWDVYGKYSAVPRTSLNDGEPVQQEEVTQRFQDLSWPPMNNAIKYHSPVEGDGGGATYYFEPSTGMAYHRAGYW